MDELRLDLSEATELVEAGADYRHYKDSESIYRVAGFAIAEATDEVVVAYAKLTDQDVVFTRSLKSWLEVVDDVPRFSLINRGN